VGKLREKRLEIKVTFERGATFEIKDEKVAKMIKNH
jgi:hypothetical protein